MPSFKPLTGEFHQLPERYVGQYSLHNLHGNFLKRDFGTLNLKRLKSNHMMTCFHVHCVESIVRKSLSELSLKNIWDNV